MALNHLPADFIQGVRASNPCLERILDLAPDATPVVRHSRTSHYRTYAHR
ncbi:hypothetical protein ACFVTY_24740 [Streptomyces sp. NPDC058067]